MTTHIQFTKMELAQIAKQQKILIISSAGTFVVLLAYMFVFGPEGTLLTNILGMLIVGQMLLLAHRMRSPAKWIYFIFALLPGLICIASLSTLIYRAGLLLKANGVPAGLFGVKTRDLEALQE